MLDRRVFLARAGVLGAALAAPGAVDVLFAPPAKAGPLEDLVAWLRPVLQALARETFDGLTAFVVPGPDAHSLAQGTWRWEAGGLAADAGRFTMDVLDNYLPFPDQIVVPLALSAAQRSGEVPARLPAEFLRLGHPEAQRLDGALRFMFDNDATVPLSIIVAILLNATGTLLHPGVLLRLSPFSSQFAKLNVAEKATVLADLESQEPQLVALVRPLLGDLTDELNGLIKFIMGALIALPGMGTGAEWQVFDPATKTLRRRPVGWELTKYLPGRRAGVEGHREFLGYYQGRS